MVALVFESHGIANCCNGEIGRKLNHADRGLVIFGLLVRAHLQLRQVVVSKMIYIKEDILANTGA